MSRRQRSAPKANVLKSVRLGLESITEGNEASIRSMLSASSDDDLVEKLVDCMGVNNLNAEMLLANYFNAGMLAKYAARLGKSEKGGAASLAERIAREWAKPSFAPPTSEGKMKAASSSATEEGDALAKRKSALDEIKAKRAKQVAKQASAAAAETKPSAPPDSAAEANPSSEAQGGEVRGNLTLMFSPRQVLGDLPTGLADPGVLDAKGTVVTDGEKEAHSNFLDASKCADANKQAS